MVTHWNRFPREVVNTSLIFTYHLWRYSGPNWTRSWATCSIWPCFGQGTNYTISRGTFHCQPFCDAVML